MTVHSIVRCPRCGQANRLTPAPANKKVEHSCGRCDAPLATAHPVASSRSTSPNTWGGAIKILLICVSAIYAWAAWPVSGWLGLCLGVSWVLNRLAIYWFPFNAADSKAILRPALRLAIQNVAKALIYVGVGIAIVSLVQIGLSLVSHVSPPILREAELILSDVRAWLNELLGFEKLLIALGLLLAAVMLFPRSRLMTRMLKARTVLGRAYLVLLGLTSFTFFSGVGVELREERWQRQARFEAHKNLVEADQLSREITSIAWVEETIKQLPDEQRQAASRFFVYAVKQLSPTNEIKELARRLAAVAPDVESRKVDIVKAGAVGGGGIDPRMEVHINSSGSIVQHDAPTLRQVEVAVVEASNRRARLAAVRTAAIEAAAEGLANLVASGQRPLAKEFVEELVASLSRGSLSRIVPRVDNFDAAKAWVQANLLSTSTEVAGGEAKWVWDTAHFEPKVKVAPFVLPGSRVPHVNPYGFSTHNVPKAQIPRPTSMPRFRFRL